MASSTSDVIGPGHVRPSALNRHNVVISDRTAGCEISTMLLSEPPFAALRDAGPERSSLW